jgi:pantoate kinase
LTSTESPGEIHTVWYIITAKIVVASGARTFGLSLDSGISKRVNRILKRRGINWLYKGV